MEEEPKHQFPPPPSAEELERIRSKYMDTDFLDGDPTKTEVLLLLSFINLMMERLETSNRVIGKIGHIKKEKLRVLVGRY